MDDVFLSNFHEEIPANPRILGRKSSMGEFSGCHVWFPQVTVYIDQEDIILAYASEQINNLMIERWNHK